MTGILLVDKAAGWTSHDVIAKLRGVLGVRRIGHSGTLDPMATGLLVVFLGRATRAVQFAQGDDKEYLARIRFGITTNTQDTTGNILTETPCLIDKSQLEGVLPEFTGKTTQLPPMYSAVRIGGKRLYEMARKGREVERQPRPIEISRLEVTGRHGSDFELLIACSKGTYIRSLCHDIGQKLGCGAVMSGLCRTRAGRFTLSQASSLEEIIARMEKGQVSSLIRPVDLLFEEYRAVTANPGQEAKCRSGAEFAVEAPDGRYRVYGQDGSFLMLGQARSGIMKTVKSFFEV